MKRLRDILKESIELLLEYDQDTTWKQHGKKIIGATQMLWHIGTPHRVLDKAMGAPTIGTKYADHDYNSPEAHERIRAHIMPHLEATDPTPNKKYVQHIARIYGMNHERHQGDLEFEDLHARMRPALERFDDLVKRKVMPPEQRDIGKIKSLEQLEDLVDTHEGESKNERDSAHHEEMKKQASITDHPTFTHIIPRTAEAAQHFGRGTRWCTATRNLSDSMFDTYNDKGNLHIYIPKDPIYPGEKYQGHYDGQDDQFMDEKDHSVGPGTMEKMHPEIHKHFMDHIEDSDKKSGTLLGLTHSEPWVRASSAKEHPDAVKANLDKYLNDPSNIVRFHAQLHLPPESEEPRKSMSAMLDGFGMEGYAGEEYAHLLSQHKLHPGHIKGVLDHIYDGSTSNEYSLLDHVRDDWVTPHTIDAFATHENMDLQGMALKSKHIKPEHLDHLIKYGASGDIQDEAREKLENWDKPKETKRRSKPLNQITWHGRN